MQNGVWQLVDWKSPVAGKAQFLILKNGRIDGLYFLIDQFKGDEFLGYMESTIVNRNTIQIDFIGPAASSVTQTLFLREFSDGTFFVQKRCNDSWIYWLAEASKLHELSEKRKELILNQARVPVEIKNIANEADNT